MCDRLRPDRVVEIAHDTTHPLHNEARAILRAYAKRWNRSTKRSPPTFFICIPPGAGQVEANAVGWGFTGGAFVNEVAMDGLGKNRRQEARDGAWDFYEEIWQEAHDALKRAGAFGQQDAQK